MSEAPNETIRQRRRYALTARSQAPTPRHPIVQDWLDGNNDAGGCIADLERSLARAEELDVMRLAGISTAAIGYWKEGDSIHPDYDTVALRDVCKLYRKYVEQSDCAEKAEARIAELEPDARRYRWLRQKSSRQAMTGKKHAGQIQVVQWADRSEANVLTYAALDSAIDAMEDGNGKV